MKIYRYYWCALDSDCCGYADCIDDCVLQADGKTKHFQVMYNKSRKVIREYIYRK
jgi:hypothetical protein